MTSEKLLRAVKQVIDDMRAEGVSDAAIMAMGFKYMGRDWLVLTQDDFPE